MSTLRWFLATFLKQEAIGVFTVTYPHHGIRRSITTTFDLKKKHVESNQTSLFTDRVVSRINRCGTGTKPVLRDARAWTFTDVKL